MAMKLCVCLQFSIVQSAYQQARVVLKLQSFD